MFEGAKKFNKLIWQLHPFALIMIIVFLFNITYLFVDALWIDDTLFYYWASEGLPLYKNVSRAEVCFLTPFRDHFYSYGMVYMGLPVIRGIYVLLMGLSSTLFFYLYKNVFGFNYKLSILAAVVPNILPGLEDIPFGLNATYALWSLVLVVLCLLLLKKAFTLGNIYKSIFLFTGALLIYYFSLNISSAGMFFSPVLVFFCLFFFPINRFLSIINSILFSLLGLWQMFKYLQIGHRDPTYIPKEIVLERTQKFFEWSSFLPFNQAYSFHITLALLFLGLVGLLLLNPTLCKQPNHFNYSRNLYRILISIWPLIWMISNGFSYVALSQEFTTHYAYIFNFGAVQLQSVGIVFLGLLVFQIFNINKQTTHVIIGLLIFVIIFFVGIQRIQYRNHSFFPQYNCIPSLERQSSFLRENLSKYSIPQETQILILEMGAHHKGHYDANSGYLRYLLKRNDIYGLIGSDIYPNNVFGKGGFMRGFNLEKPVLALRKKDEKLEQVELLLQVASSVREKRSLLQWTLYDISSVNHPPIVIATGEGMSTYNDYIQNKIPSELQNADIAFAPVGTPHDLMDSDFIETNFNFAEDNLIEHRINFGSYFSLLGVSRKLTTDNNHELQLLIQLDKFPNEPFLLGYKLVKGDKLSECEPLYIWEYVQQEGNCFLLNLPYATEDDLIGGISFGLTNNIIPWAPKPLTVHGGEYNGADTIMIRWDRYADNAFAFPEKIKILDMQNIHAEGNAILFSGNGYISISDQQDYNNYLEIGLTFKIDEFQEKNNWLFKKVGHGWPNDVSFTLGFQPEYIHILLSENGSDVDGIWLPGDYFKKGVYYDLLLLFNNGFLEVYINNELALTKDLGIKKIYSSNLPIVIGEDFYGSISNFYISHKPSAGVDF